MRRRLIAIIAYLSVSLSVSLPLAAQDTASLGDIRSELVRLNTDIQALRAEMVRSGQTGVAISGDVLRRVDAIEAQMAQLTAQTEQLENRINRVVSDGTNRVGDLNFRLTELEGGDLSTLGETPVLGGDAKLPPSGTAPDAPSGTAGTGDVGAGDVELAISERADFDRAQAAFEADDFQAAADQFATFNQSYPGGPLMGEADFFRGEALGRLGQWNTAARAYLDSFSGAPDSPLAPQALYKLGLALHELGQSDEACLMLREVGARFGGSDQAEAARGAMQTIGCS